MRLLLLLPSLLLACSEYELVGDKEGKPGPDTAIPDEDTSEPIDTSVPTIDEVCNGVDDDGDGEIDEGFEDVDADGIADCLDDACTADGAAAGTVELEDACAAYDPGEVADPWDVGLEWEYRASGTDYSVVSPVFGQLTDDNGDGVIDDLDMPDIAFTGYYSSKLFLVSGDGSGLHCSRAGFRNDGGVAIGDIDGDGKNEIVGPMTDGKVMALDGTCTPKWVSSSTYSFLYPVCTLADLDADGDVEVICDNAVVDGATGAPVATLAPVNAAYWRTPAVGDLDLDGQQEVVLGDSVFAPNGTRRWSTTATGAAYSCFSSIQNIDSDSEAEVAFSCGQGLKVHNHDGTLAWQAALGVPNPGPPCAGDIDGDGMVEIIAPNGNKLSAFNHDGTALWTKTMQDSSGAAGCAVFDMNGDSIYEVIFADEVALRVYDGASGTVLYENRTHGSVTYFETPTIGDVDNDGSAEMLVVNSSGSYGMMTVFGHGGSGWPAAGPTWGIHDFAASNQNSDGSLPTSPTPSWLAYNIFRGRPSADIPGVGDLTVSLIDVCVSSCDVEIGTVGITYQVANPGGLDTEQETVIALYMLDATGVETLHSTAVVPTVAMGTSAVSGEFVVPLAEMGAGGFTLRVDDDGLGVGILTECFEDNNEVTYPESFCGM